MLARARKTKKQRRMKRRRTRRQRGGYHTGIDLVISRYKEKLQWLKEYEAYEFKHVYIYNKSDEPIDCPPFKNPDTRCSVTKAANVGVCDHTYLHHIVEHYDTLADVTVFVPGSAEVEYKKPMLDFILQKVRETRDTVLNTFDFKTEVGEAMYNFTMETYPTRYDGNRESVGRAPQKLAHMRPFGAWYHAHFPDVNVTKSTFFGLMAVSRKHIHQRPKAYYKSLMKHIDTDKFHEASHFIERSWQAVFSPLPDSCMYTSDNMNHLIGHDQGGYTMMRRQQIKLAVMCIFKNEKMTIREWVDHYKWQGADEILMLDNGSTDGGAELVKKRKNVTVLPAPKQHAQAANYNEIGYPWLKEHGITVLAIVDMDEYVFGTDGKNLKEHVTELFSIPVRPSSYSIQWTMFGSSGFEKQPHSIRESFVWKKKDLDWNIKSIMWLDDVLPGGLDLHSSKVSGIQVKNPPGLQLNHYTIQSREYFEKVKMHRGDATTPDTVDANRRDWGYFSRYDFREVEDTKLRDLVLHKTKAPDFDKAAVYKENIHTADDFGKLSAYCAEISAGEMVDDFKASGRLMYEIPSTDPIVHTIFTKHLMDQVHLMTGNKRLKPCYKVPVEYRTYGVGSSMDWHKDTQILPDQEQYECVLTLTNTSDSKTVLEHAGGKNEMHTPPNSLLIVRANGIRHMVTKLKKGKRTIIKFVLCE